MSKKLVDIPESVRESLLTMFRAQYAQDLRDGKKQFVIEQIGSFLSASGYTPDSISFFVKRINGPKELVLDDELVRNPERARPTIEQFNQSLPPKACKHKEHLKGNLAADQNIKRIRNRQKIRVGKMRKNKTVNSNNGVYNLLDKAQLGGKVDKIAKSVIKTWPSELARKLPEQYRSCGKWHVSVIELESDCRADNAQLKFYHVVAAKHTITDEAKAFWLPVDEIENDLLEIKLIQYRDQAKKTDNKKMGLFQQMHFLNMKVKFKTNQSNKMKLYRNGREISQEQ